MVVVVRPPTGPPVTYARPEHDARDAPDVQRGVDAPEPSRAPWRV
jgi:hypothetical protein